LVTSNSVSGCVKACVKDVAAESFPENGEEKKRLRGRFNVWFDVCPLYYSIKPRTHRVDS